VTDAGVASARLSADQLEKVIPDIDDAQWDSPSSCAGWRNIDVLAHLAALAHEAVEPPPLEAGLPTIRERYHDLRVNQRRGLSHAEVIHEWRTYTPRQLDLLQTAQDDRKSAERVTVPGLGVYPRHLLANTMAFNVFCHLRYDMVAPDGPLPVTLPPPTDQQVSPAIDFMLAGLPQMQGPELDATVSVPLVLDLTGPGETIVTVHPPQGPGGRLTVTRGVEGSTWIRCTALSFIAWGTKRKPWREFCSVTGDEASAASFLDCLNII
jgi:uncharacterized protein (TIGR03083 family)